MKRDVTRASLAAVTTRIPANQRAEWRTPTSLLARLATRISAALPLMVALALCAAGVATLAWDYALLPGELARNTLYWLGLGLAYCGVVIFGTASRPRAPRQLFALALFGAVTWLPYFLRSPQRLLFSDERFHLDILTRIAEQGHTGFPVTLFSLPGAFPGLEDATLALTAWTGLSSDLAIRLTTLLIHLLIPMLAYLIARGMGLGRRGAFIAALIYAANTSYFFFHSVFSYESLGIVLFLSVWALVALYGRWPRRSLPRWSLPRRKARRPVLPPEADIEKPKDRGRPFLLAVAIPLVGAIAVTHHLSSYILLISLAIAWVSAALVRAPGARAIGFVLVASLVLTGAWFLQGAGTLVQYLYTTIADRIQGIIQAFESTQPRQLFANSDVPLIERLTSFAYPPLIGVLCIAGLVLYWRQGRQRLSWLPIAIVGPIGWIATTPAVLTHSGELAYRSWPFLFVGVAIFASTALADVARRLSHRVRIPGQVMEFGVVALLLAGGFIIGDNQGGRFPTTEPTTAAGSGNQTDDVIAAATWLLETAGENHVVATDTGSAVTFATTGRQRIVRYAPWVPFVTPDPADIAPYMFANGVEYVVADRQITQLAPRYGGYFGKPAIPIDIDPGVPFPTDLLARFDAVPELERIYDNGRILIYRLIPGAGVRP